MKCEGRNRRHNQRCVLQPETRPRLGAVITEAEENGRIRQRTKLILSAGKIYSGSRANKASGSSGPSRKANSGGTGRRPGRQKAGLREEEITLGRPGEGGCPRRHRVPRESGPRAGVRAVTTGAEVAVTPSGAGRRGHEPRARAPPGAGRPGNRSPPRAGRGNAARPAPGL